MLKSHTDFNIQHANQNNANNSISCIFVNCNKNILFCYFCCATSDTRHQIKLANKNNSRTNQLHNLSMPQCTLGVSEYVSSLYNSREVSTPKF